MRHLFRDVRSILTPAITTACLAVLGLTMLTPAAAAAPTPMVDLGAASSYAVISGASVGNTVSAPGMPFTTLRGDLAVKANTPPTGFPPGIVTGQMQIGTAAAATAHDALVAAYVEIAGRIGGAPLAGALVGVTVLPGLHTIGGAVSNTGTVTLDAAGDPNAVFVFQVNGAMAMAAGSHVVLARGAQASRVFWQVNGAAAIGANADFVGTVIAMDAVAIGNSSIINGRAFARNGALTLDANEVYSAPPVVTIDGGAASITTDTTPTISGTTDLEAPAQVTVTIDGQSLLATPAAGTWSVTSAILPNATYAVVASGTDGADNVGSATQDLTIDTVLPVVTIDGGASLMSNDATPTIAGTSDVAPGSVVQIGIDALQRTALVQADGTWNTTAPTLTEGAHAIDVTVTDPAGNDGVAAQALTVDTVAPAVTLTGGLVALTNDATPTVAGTTSAPPGTAVTIAIGTADLVATVQVDGSWSATSPTQLDSSYRIDMSIADTAGNVARASQTLTIDTRAPIIAIAGGATAVTSDATPTITGVTDATVGTTVTVSVAGQTMTSLVQPDGSWNATPSSVGIGAWSVAASVPDPAGNIGLSMQQLTIEAVAVPVPTVAPPVTSIGTVTVVTVAPVAIVELRATTTLSLTSSARTIRPGSVVKLRGVLRSSASGARRAVKVQIWQRVGSRWVLRKTSRVNTTASGAYIATYVTPRGRRATWRVRASFAGTSALRPAASGYRSFVTR